MLDPVGCKVQGWHQNVPLDMCHASSVNWGTTWSLLPATNGVLLLLLLAGMLSGVCSSLRMLRACWRPARMTCQ